MKDKIISYNSCVSIFQPNLKRSFATISPVNIISEPTTTMVYSWAGSVSSTSNPSIAFGTIERWRHEPTDAKPLNRDQWVLWSTGTPSLIRLEDIEKKSVLNHWSSELPKEVNDVAPSWVKSLMQAKLNEKRRG